MKKKILITGLIAATIVYASSCYNNKEDILSLPRVSFLGDVVPIMTSGACGCHNNLNSNNLPWNNGTPAVNNAVPFTKIDSVKDPNTGAFIKLSRTILYDAIIARVDTFRLWVNGAIGHPGGGNVDLTAREKEIIREWINQGSPYDGGGIACVIPANIRYTADISPVYNTTCKSSGCHGGRGPALDYNKLVADKNILTNMMNSAGSNGHPGGVVGLSSCVTGKFLAWIAAGQPN